MNRTRRAARGLLLVLAAGITRPAAAQGPRLGLIPYPAQVQQAEGTHSFASPPVIVAESNADTELTQLAHYAARALAEALGTPARVAGTAAADGGSILLAIDPVFPDTSAEAYQLVADASGVRITARGYPGLFYGIQTLRQLLRAAPADGWPVPAVRIADRPRFAYRGLHLDVARHFFPVDVVKRYIDLLARYKLNTFHWHLTDDQGWRIEIKRYPRLTEVGAFRKETMVEKNFDPYVGDGVPHGGFYTQDEIRDVVAYAAERYVTVIPEIEMPGHAMAALAAYPELACTPGPFDVGTRWGVYDDVFCPSERTFEFLEGVLTEVLALFPGRYIHVGGDEVPKVRWRESELAQAVMRRRGLANEEELQSYFIRRMETFLNRNGRRLIGWDEILEGGLPPRATVMSWRGTAGGIAAAREGHDVIMSPGSHLYFDHSQGDPDTEPLAIGGYSPLERVYQFEPVPDELTAEEGRHVLGPQANLWTEYVTTAAHLEYMAFPRALALAEVAWSPRDRRDWASFRARIPAELAALDQAGVRYRIPEVGGLDGDGLALDSLVAIRLSSELPHAAIHYTTDGSEPTVDSPRYAGAFTLDVNQPARVQARVVLPSGRAGPVRTTLFRRVTLRSAERVDEAALVPGLAYTYIETRIRSVAALARGVVPAVTGIAERIALQGTERAEHFALRFAGLIHVPADGIYRFTLLSDDGAALAIGDSVIVDHDGLHAATEKSGSVALQAGYHPIAVSYFQAEGGTALELFVAWPGAERMALPAAWLSHR